MNELMSFSSSVAQATEIMCSVLSGSLCKWLDTRLDWYGGFVVIWCNTEDEERFLRRRIQSFCETLRELRIMRITLGSTPDNGAGLMARRFHFHLGDAKNQEVVVVEVILQCDSSKPDDRALWGIWYLNRYNGIRCIKHPKAKFNNCIILGRNALEIEV